MKFQSVDILKNQINYNNSNAEYDKSKTPINRNKIIADEFMENGGSGDVFDSEEEVYKRKMISNRNYNNMDMEIDYSSGNDKRGKYVPNMNNYERVRKFNNEMYSNQKDNRNYRV